MHSCSLQGLSCNMKNPKLKKNPIPISINSNPNPDQFLIGSKISNVACNYKIMGEKFQNLERKKKMENAQIPHSNMNNFISNSKYSYLSNNSILKNNSKISSSRIMPPSKNITTNIFKNQNYINPFDYPQKKYGQKTLSNRGQVLTTSGNNIIEKNVVHEQKHSFAVRQKSITKDPSGSKGKGMDCGNANAKGIMNGNYCGGNCGNYIKVNKNASEINGINAVNVTNGCAGNVIHVPCNSNKVNFNHVNEKLFNFENMNINGYKDKSRKNENKDKVTTINININGTGSNCANGTSGNNINNGNPNTLQNKLKAKTLIKKNTNKIVHHNKNSNSRSKLNQNQSKGSKNMNNNSYLGIKKFNSNEAINSNLNTNNIINNQNQNNKKYIKKPEISTNMFSELFQNEKVNSCKYSNNYQILNINPLTRKNNNNKFYNILTTFNNICNSVGNNNTNGNININNIPLNNQNNNPNINNVNINLNLNRRKDLSKERYQRKSFSKENNIYSYNILSVKAGAINNILNDFKNEKINKNNILLYQKRYFSANSNNVNHQKNKSGNNININKIGINNFVISKNNDKVVKHNHNRTNFAVQRYKNEPVHNYNNSIKRNNINFDSNIILSNNVNKSYIPKGDKPKPEVKLDLNPILQGIKLFNNNNSKKNLQDDDDDKENNNNLNKNTNINNNNLLNLNHNDEKFRKINLHLKNNINNDISKALLLRKNASSTSKNTKRTNKSNSSNNNNLNKSKSRDENHQILHQEKEEEKHNRVAIVLDDVDNDQDDQEELINPKLINNEINTNEINNENEIESTQKDTRNNQVSNTEINGQYSKHTFNSNSTSNKTIPKSKINFNLNNLNIVAKNLFEDEDYEYDNDEYPDDDFDDLESIVKILPFSKIKVDEENFFSTENGGCKEYKEFSKNFDKHFDMKVMNKNKNKNFNLNTVINGPGYNNNSLIYNTILYTINSKKNKSSERKSAGNLSFSTQDNSNKKFISPIQSKNAN